MQEDHFADYHDGFRLGTFDKCNGRGDKRTDPAFALAWSNMHRDGYSDGFDGNEQQIGPPVRTPLELLVIQCYAALSCDNGVDVAGNERCAISVLDTIKELASFGLLTMPEKPPIEDIHEYAITNWGVDPDYLMEI